MKPLKIFSKDYYTKLPHAPVLIKPFNPQMKLIGKEYIKNIEQILSPWHVKAKIIGSTAYEIAGQGGIEVGIYLTNSNWNEVLNRLEHMDIQKDVLEHEFAQYIDNYQGYKIDLLLMKGHTARVNKHIYDFFIKHPDIAQKYEAIKKKFSYSKQEYQKQKTEFINDIVEELPEEDFYTEKYEKDFDL